MSGKLYCTFVFIYACVYYRVRTRFGIYENVLKMTVPISRPGKGIEIEQKYEKVWKITLAYKLCTSVVISWA